MRALSIAVTEQHAAEQGYHCWACASPFVQPHGHRVLCVYCWRNTMPPDRDSCVKATHAEFDVANAKAKAAAKRYALRKACPNDTLDERP